VVGFGPQRLALPGLVETVREIQTRRHWPDPEDGRSHRRCFRTGVVGHQAV